MRCANLLVTTLEMAENALISEFSNMHMFFGEIVMRYTRLAAGLLVLSLPTSVYSSPSSSDSDVIACDAGEAGNVLVLMGQVQDATQSNSCVDGVAAGSFGSEGLRTSSMHFTNDLKNNSGDSSVTFFGESNLNGLAAGERFNGWGLWASASHNVFDGDNNPEAGGAIGATKLVYNADTTSMLFGADRFVTDRLILGLAAGYESTDVFTFFNGGNTDTEGFTVAPYAAFLINDMFSVDVAFGYTSLENDTDRLQLGTGATLLGEFDSDRYFATTNLNVAHTNGNWYTGGRIGYLYSYEEQDGYTETGGTGGGAAARTVGSRNIHISQLILGGEVAYNFGRQEPYVGATYVYDLSRGIGRNAGGLPGGVAPDFDDEDEIRLNAGVRYFATYFTAVVDVTHVVSRNNFDSTSAMLTVRTDL